MGSISFSLFAIGSQSFMKQSLQLKLGQQPTMTPQLQQAIRLLQLSTLDLQQEIQEALESNPMLEVAESEDGSDSNSNEDNDQKQEIASADNNRENNTESTKDESDWQDSIPEDLPVDTQWDDIYQGSGTGSVGPVRGDGFFARQIDNSETL